MKSRSTQKSASPTFMHIFFVSPMDTVCTISSWQWCECAFYYAAVDTLPNSCVNLILQSIYTWHKKIPWQFLKPAVCKYLLTVNNSEINILLPKPCPWMWHLMCRNCVRFGSIRKPETGKTHSLKLALLKIPIGAAL